MSPTDPAEQLAVMHRKEHEQIDATVAQAFQSIRGIDDKMSQVLITIAELSTALRGHMQDEEIMRDDFRREIVRLENQLREYKTQSENAHSEIRSDLKAQNDRQIKWLFSVCTAMGGALYMLLQNA